MLYAIAMWSQDNTNAPRCTVLQSRRPNIQESAQNFEGQAYYGSEPLISTLSFFLSKHSMSSKIYTYTVKWPGTRWDVRHACWNSSAFSSALQGAIVSPKRFDADIERLPFCALQLAMLESQLQLVTLDLVLRGEARLIHTYIHAYIHTYIHTYIHSYIHTL